MTSLAAVAVQNPLTSLADDVAHTRQRPGGHAPDRWRQERHRRHHLSQ